MAGIRVAVVYLVTSLFHGNRAGVDATFANHVLIRKTWRA